MQKLNTTIWAARQGDWQKATDRNWQSKNEDWPKNGQRREKSFWVFSLSFSLSVFCPVQHCDNYSLTGICCILAMCRKSHTGLSTHFISLSITQDHLRITWHSEMTIKKKTPNSSDKNTHFALNPKLRNESQQIKNNNIHDTSPKFASTYIRKRQHKQTWQK